MVKRLKDNLRKILPSPILKIYHFLWALFGGLLYGFPSKDMTVIGVTGTNGKSTTVKLIAKILKESKRDVAVMSSIDFEIAGSSEPNLMKMTMPGRGFIQRFLKRAKKKDCDLAVLEVTSEGVEQFRHKFIDFDVAVFTNLAPEHIESHGSFEEYRRAKGKFFEQTDKTHVLNVADEHVDYFEGFDCEKRYGYSLKEVEKNNYFKVLTTERAKSGPTGVEFTYGDEKFEMDLLGKFNIENGLAALAVADHLEVPLTICKTALSKVERVPGRMEKVIDDEFKVFVDYAFTPNALGKVYKDLRENFEPEKMIAVLGSCGGGRDKWKRPVLGELAAEHADEIIVTNEDPYDEDPMKIIEDVAEGTSGKAEKILDRREAIRRALKAAEKDSVVIVTGKGSESWIQVEDGEKIPWDDRKVIREEYNKIKSGNNVDKK